jgi:hypothetical protein
MIFKLMLGKYDHYYNYEMTVMIKITAVTKITNGESELAIVQHYLAHNNNAMVFLRIFLRVFCVRF